MYSVRHIGIYVILFFPLVFVHKNCLNQLRFTRMSVLQSISAGSQFYGLTVKVILLPGGPSITQRQSELALYGDDSDRKSPLSPVCSILHRDAFKKKRKLMPSHRSQKAARMHHSGKLDTPYCEVNDQLLQYIIYANCGS